jgi:hypothetical protein
LPHVSAAASEWSEKIEIAVTTAARTPLSIIEHPPVAAPEEPIGASFEIPETLGPLRDPVVHEGTRP